MVYREKLSIGPRLSRVFERPQQFVDLHAAIQAISYESRFLLDAQRRLVDAESSYLHSLLAYGNATRLDSHMRRLCLHSMLKVLDEQIGVSEQLRDDIPAHLKAERGPSSRAVLLLQVDAARHCQS